MASSGQEPIWPTPDPVGAASGALLQHGSDPVSWWSPDVPLERPDWLADSEVGLSDEAVMTWHPVVTFWQLRRSQRQAVPDG
jgi:uncharacterized membrane protein